MVGLDGVELGHLKSVCHPEKQQPRRPLGHGLCLPVAGFCTKLTQPVVLQRCEIKGCKRPDHTGGLWHPLKDADGETVGWHCDACYQKAGRARRKAAGPKPKRPAKR